MQQEKNSRRVKIVLLCLDNKSVRFNRHHLKTRDHESIAHNDSMPFFTTMRKNYCPQCNTSVVAR